MQVPTVTWGDLTVTRFMIGGNPFSGFSHQSQQRTEEMLAWYTDERIIETLFQAESLGLTACLSRGDDHVTGVMKKYWDQGGTMRWIAQTDSRAQTPAIGAQYCIDHGASACYLHGGVMDFLVAQQEYGAVHEFIETVRAGGISVGLAGHMPGDFLWAEEHADVDFYMVCYYNPSPRDKVPHHDPAAAEQYLEKDREERVATIAKLSRPAIHYKILAAGRTDPEEAFAYTGQHLRPDDAICVGVYTKDNPNMIRDDIELFLKYLD